jgi:hypothetical protein
MHGQNAKLLNFKTRETIRSGNAKETLWKNLSFLRFRQLNLHSQCNMANNLWAGTGLLHNIRNHTDMRKVYLHVHIKSNSNVARCQQLVSRYTAEQLDTLTVYGNTISHLHIPFRM